MLGRSLGYPGLAHCIAGLMVQERNWLEVYPYTGWGGNDNLPPLQEGQQFLPADLLLKQVQRPIVLSVLLPYMVECSGHASMYACSCALARLLMGSRATL